MQRFGSPTVPGIPPPHAMYQLDPGAVVPAGQPSPQPLLDFHPVIFLFFFYVKFLEKLFFIIYEKTIKKNWVLIALKINLIFLLENTIF